MYIEDLFFRVKKLEVQDLKTDIIEKKDKWKDVSESKMYER